MIFENSVKSLANSQMMQEYRSNKRLQWMVVGIAAILVVSLLKTLADNRSEQQAELKTQLALVARLQAAADSPVDESQTDTLMSMLDKAKQNIPEADSKSVAEAKALAAIEQSVGHLISRKRLNLVGAEEHTAGTQTYWSVRLNLAGQLKGSKLVEFLQHFDSSSSGSRITSMQYAPKTSDTINVVVDLLYKRVNNE